jgi:hypothetical protein
MPTNMDVLVHVPTAKRSWTPVSPWDLEQHWSAVLRGAKDPYLRETWLGGRWWEGQDSDLYAILTGITVSAVDECGDMYTPVAPTRGLPGGVRPRRDLHDEEWSDGRTFGSWVSLAELNRYDWDRPVHRFAYCAPAEFERYVAGRCTGEPAAFSRQVGERVTVIGADDARARLATRGEIAVRGTREERLTRVRVDYEVTHGEAAGAFYRGVLPLMRTIDADPARLRVTFRLY